MNLFYETIVFIFIVQTLYVRVYYVRVNSVLHFEKQTLYIQ